jgi:hypothetical protein
MITILGILLCMGLTISVALLAMAFMVGVYIADCT